MNREENHRAWVLGAGEHAMAFYSGQQEGMAPGSVLYSASLTEVFRMGETDGSEAFYLLPSAEQHNDLPAFFEELSRRERYLVYWMLPSEGGPVFPDRMVEEIHGLRFVRFSFVRMDRVSRWLKRGFDLLICILGLTGLSPLLLFCALMVRFGSKGSVFYSQDRIGKGGNVFRIYKFRSMRVGAETGTPCLSSKGDPRITAWGNIMRKYRMDELPQLWNVIRGDMSVVGYRPERRYFIERIVKEAPYYSLLYTVKPGITSLGITTFGYAENVGQMVVRLSFDMLYLDRLSLREDIRILGKTCRVIMYGVGK